MNRPLRQGTDIIKITKYIAGVNPEDMTKLYLIFKPMEDYPWLEITLDDAQCLSLWDVFNNDWAEQRINKTHSFAFSVEFMDLMTPILMTKGYDEIYFEVDEHV